MQLTHGETFKLIDTLNERDIQAHFSYRTQLM